MAGTVARDLDRDILGWRQDTPGCSRVTHLNNAGAALPPGVVRKAINEHLDLESDVGGYEAAEMRSAEVREVYAALGMLLGARGENVGLMQNSTVAFAQAISAFDLGPKDSILTSQDDYASNQIMYLSLAQKRGVRVVRAPDAPEGGIDPEEVRRLVARQRPTLIALTWIPTNSGLVQPAELIGEICQASEVPYLLDACQAVGQMPIDVTRLGCDFLSGTARKFVRGPRGLGFLYVSDRMLEGGAYPLLIDMHGATWTERDRFELTPDARRFETWEFAYALMFGLGAAARYALDVGLETARDRSWDLATYVRERLAGLSGVRVLDRGTKLCAIATAAIEGWHSRDVKLALRRRGINTSSPEREDAVIDMDAKHATSALRISPHYYNTREEIDTAVEALSEVLAEGPSVLA
jgi:selenocysteine lyase/cysteine desulfurase